MTALSDTELSILRFLREANPAGAHEVIKKMRAEDKTLTDEDVVAAVYTLHDRGAVKIHPDWKISLLADAAIADEEERKP